MKEDSASSSNSPRAAKCLKRLLFIFLQMLRISGALQQSGKVADIRCGRIAQYAIRKASLAPGFHVEGTCLLGQRILRHFSATPLSKTWPASPGMRSGHGDCVDSGIKDHAASYFP